MTEKYEKDYDDFTLRDMNEEELSGSLSPFTFIVVSFILILFGLVTGYSASYDAAVRAGLRHYQYSLEMVFYGALGLISGTFLIFTSRKNLEKLPYVLMPLSTVLLLANSISVLRTGSGILPQGFPEFRGFDFTVFSFILLVASVFPKIRNRERRGWIYLLVFFSVFLIATLMIIGGGFSYAIMFSLVVLAVFSASGMEKRYIFTFALFMLTYIAFTVLSSPEHMDMIFSRLLPFTHSSEAAEATARCLHAAADGGIWGRGLGAGWYKLGMIPGIEDDYIFASITEETGLMGVLVIMLLFSLLLSLGVRCARRGRKMGDDFLVTATIGFTSMIMLKAVLHMTVTLGIVPSGAIAMPFFSIDGLGYFVLMLELSLLYRFMHMTGRGHEKNR